MPVYKSKRGVSSAQFVETARQLEAYTLKQCLKIPKRYTFFLSTEIMRLASEVYNHAKAANSISPTNQHEAQMRRGDAFHSVQRMHRYFALLLGFHPNNKSEWIRRTALCTTH